MDHSATVLQSYQSITSNIVENIVVVENPFIMSKNTL